MEGFFEVKSKPLFLLYEFIGTALIVLTYNIGQVALGFVIFIVSIWSWEVSSAHFNPAITVAQLFIGDPGSIKGKLGSMAAILVT